jgi:hypothetical protein
MVLRSVPNHNANFRRPDRAPVNAMNPPPIETPILTKSLDEAPTRGRLQANAVEIDGIGLCPLTQTA